MSSEGTDFYYMGDVEPMSQQQETIKGKNNTLLSIVNFMFKMKDEVEDNLYNYFEEV